jgi:hypothetical protein
LESSPLRNTAAARLPASSTIVAATAITRPVDQPSRGRGAASGCGDALGASEGVGDGMDIGAGGAGGTIAGGSGSGGVSSGGASSAGGLDSGNALYVTNAFGGGAGGGGGTAGTFATVAGPPPAGARGTTGGRSPVPASAGGASGAGSSASGGLAATGAASASTGTAAPHVVQNRAPARRSDAHSAQASNAVGWLETSCPHRWHTRVDGAGPAPQDEQYAPAIGLSSLDRVTSAAGKQ